VGDELTVQVRGKVMIDQALLERVAGKIEGARYEGKGVSWMFDDRYIQPSYPDILCAREILDLQTRMTEYCGGFTLYVRPGGCTYDLGCNQRVDSDPANTTNPLLETTLRAYDAVMEPTTSQKEQK